MADPLILGTRASALALWQANHIKVLLECAGVPVVLQEIHTLGDKILDVPLAKIGDKGLFTRELDQALLDGRIHLAVHSLKDLPTKLEPGIVLAAIGEREEPRDAFVNHPDFEGTLADLPRGASIATSSLRRQSQLLALRPDLRVESVRGNVDTRLQKLDASAWQGMLLASAGLIRLGRTSRIREVIETETLLPAVGQGALGIVCADRDPDLQSTLHRVLHHEPTALACRAERAFMRRLEGGCQVPIGAYGVVKEEMIYLQAYVGAIDGSRHLRASIEMPASDPESAGVELACRMLVNGADDILARIRA